VEPAQVIPEKPPIEVKNFKTLPEGVKTTIINRVDDVIKIDNKNNVVGWGFRAKNPGTITEVIYNKPGEYTSALFIKYDNLYGEPKQIVILFNSDYKIITINWGD